MARQRSLYAIRVFKWEVHHKSSQVSLNSALSSTQPHPVEDVTLEARVELHQEPGEPSTLLLDFSHQGASYMPGDHLALFPTNSAKDVAFLKSRTLDSPPSEETLTLLESSNGKVWREVDDFPRLLCFEDFLMHVVDLSRRPSQDLLHLFIECADKQDQEKLKLLCATWATMESSVCETLMNFPSVMLPSAELVGTLQTIQPRLYSIASAPSRDKVSLVVGVTQLKSASNNNNSKSSRGTRLGLCSGLLQRAGLGTRMPAFFRTAANFKLPDDSRNPVIMIAAGSGIAPFRGFWQYRQQQARAGAKVGFTLLIYGCRMESMDLLRDETSKLSR